MKERAAAAVIGAGVGAGLMYLLDPERGKRRRAVLRDRAVHLLRSSRHALDVGVRDLSHRVHGLYARTRSRLACAAIPDPVLEDRVRSRIGHLVSRAGSIEVTVRNGTVQVAGPILAREVRGLLRRISRMRGVAAVENRLQIHETAGGVPALQGGRTATA